MSETVIGQSKYESKVQQLLDIFEQNRTAIMDMITDLEKLKDKLDTIFPETTDARHMRFFEEKVKAISSFFNVLLDMRKEINKSVKDEIETVGESIEIQSISLTQDDDSSEDDTSKIHEAAEIDEPVISTSVQVDTVVIMEYSITQE